MQKKAKMYSGNTSGCSTNLCLTAMSTPRYVTPHQLVDVCRYSVVFVGLAGAIFVLISVFITALPRCVTESWTDGGDGQDKGIEACCAFAKSAPVALAKQAAGLVVSVHSFACFWLATRHVQLKTRGACFDTWAWVVVQVL